MLALIYQLYYENTRLKILSQSSHLKRNPLLQRMSPLNPLLELNEGR